MVGGQGWWRLKPRQPGPRPHALHPRLGDWGLWHHMGLVCKLCDLGRFTGCSGGALGGRQGSSLPWRTGGWAGSGNGVTEGHCVSSFCEHQPAPSCLCSMEKICELPLGPDPHSDKDVLSWLSQGSLRTLAESRDGPGFTKASQRLSPHQIWGPIHPRWHSQAPAGLLAAVRAEQTWSLRRAGVPRELRSCVIFLCESTWYHYQGSKRFFKNVGFPPNMSFGDYLGCPRPFQCLRKNGYICEKYWPYTFFLLSPLL